MKRFFSVKDYLQTPKTNTQLFTANWHPETCAALQLRFAILADQVGRRFSVETIDVHFVEL